MLVARYHAGSDAVKGVREAFSGKRGRVMWGGGGGSNTLLRAKAKQAVPDFTCCPGILTLSPVGPLRYATCVGHETPQPSTSHPVGTSTSWSSLGASSPSAAGGASAAWSRSFSAAGTRQM